MNVRKEHNAMIYTVNLQWDSEANVWIATSEDIPGLVLEHNSLEALMERVKTVAPEILELNSHLIPKSSKLLFKSEKMELMRV